MPLPALVRDDEGFFYLSENGPESYRNWSKSQPGEGRPIEEISLVELGNAMRDIARVGLGAGREDLCACDCPSLWNQPPHSRHP